MICYLLFSTFDIIVIVTSVFKAVVFFSTQIIVVRKIFKAGGRIVFMSHFPFLFCVANVNNCKPLPARPPLGGHREVRKIEEIARTYASHTI